MEVAILLESSIVKGHPSRLNAHFYQTKMLCMHSPPVLL